MIRKFNKYSSGIIAKIFLVIIALSFVSWGIGDMFSSMGGANYVAKVGKQAISIPEFQQQMNQRMANYRQLLGTEYSPEIVKRLGLPQQVLAEMVNGILLQNEAESLGLKLSETEVMKLISNNEAFRGVNGFDKNAFQMALRQNGMNEAAYVKSLQSETSSGLLLSHLDGSELAKRPMLEALYRLRAETREATTYTFSPKSLGDAPTPSDAELDTYYDNNKEGFRTPELRQLSYVTIDPKKLRESIEVKGSKLRELYESRKEGYKTPEKRKISQLLYSKKEQAASALALLQKGSKLAEVAATIKPSNKDLNMGNLTQAELLAEAQDAVFSLAKGAHTQAIESSFGWHIFQVDEITAAAIPDFAEIEKQLRDELLESQLEDKLYQLSMDLEDRLAGGATLTDIAKELKLDVTETVYFNAQGIAADNTNAALPAVKEVLKRAFSEEIQNTPEFQLGADGNYYFLTLKDTQASAIPPLKEIRESVMAQWQEDATARKLSEKVAQIADMLKDGKYDVLKGLVYETAKTGKFSRGGESDDANLTPKLREELFTLKVGETSKAMPTDNGEWVIAKLEKITSAAEKEISDADLEGLRNEMSEQYSEELMQQYLGYLRRKFPIEVNQAALNSVLK